MQSGQCLCLWHFWPKKHCLDDCKTVARFRTGWLASIEAGMWLREFRWCAIDGSIIDRNSDWTMNCLFWSDYEMVESSWVDAMPSPATHFECRDGINKRIKHEIIFGAGHVNRFRWETHTGYGMFTQWPDHSIDARKVRRMRQDLIGLCCFHFTSRWCVNHMRWQTECSFKRSHSTKPKSKQWFSRNHFREVAWHSD